MPLLYSVRIMSFFFISSSISISIGVLLSIFLTSNANLVSHISLILPLNAALCTAVLRSLPNRSSTIALIREHLSTKQIWPANASSSKTSPKFNAFSAMPLHVQRCRLCRLLLWLHLVDATFERRECCEFTTYDTTHESEKRDSIGVSWRGIAMYWFGWYFDDDDKIWCVCK